MGVAGRSRLKSEAATFETENCCPPHTTIFLLQFSTSPRRRMWQTPRGGSRSTRRPTGIISSRTESARYGGPNHLWCKRGTFCAVQVSSSDVLVSLPTGRGGKGAGGGRGQGSSRRAAGASPREETRQKWPQRRLCSLASSSALAGSTAGCRPDLRAGAKRSGTERSGCCRRVRVPCASQDPPLQLCSPQRDFHALPVSTGVPATAAAHNVAAPAFTFAMVRRRAGFPLLSGATVVCKQPQLTRQSSSPPLQDPRQQMVAQPLPVGGEHHPHHPNGGATTETEARENEQKAALASGYPPGASCSALPPSCTSCDCGDSPPPHTVFFGCRWRAEVPKHRALQEALSSLFL